jgi:hypothetical protein
MLRAAGSAVLILLASCGGKPESTSSGSAGSGDSGGTYDCQSAYDNMVSAGCATPDGGVTGFVSLCELTVTTGCDAEWQAYLRCVSTATITCDASGRLDIFTPCGSQSMAFLACSACTPQTSDNACQTCIRSTCCAEEKALYSDPDYVDYSNCVRSCRDATCLQACDERYAGFLQKSSDAWSCANAHCTACPQQPP